MVLIFLNLEIKRPCMPFIDKVRSIDWAGGFLFTGSASIFLMGLSWAGSQYPWSSPAVIVPVIIGAVGFAAAVMWEAYGAKHKFIRHQVFATRTAKLAYLCIFFQGVVVSILPPLLGQVLTKKQMCALLYYIPFYFETVKNKSASGSGVDLISVSGGFIITAAVNSILMTRFGQYRWAI